MPARVKANPLPPLSERLITVPSQELLTGDTIVELREKGPAKQIRVTHVEYSSDHCRGIHVNNTMCYDWGAMVNVLGKE